MDKRKIGCIYLIFACIIIGVIGYFMLNNNLPINKSNTIINEENTSSISLSDIEKEEVERLKKIIEEIYIAENDNKLFHRGEYPGRADSRELNPEFIIDEPKLYDPVDGVEIEFLTYEVLPDVSAYIDDKNFRIDDYENFYIKDGWCNKDGTFNTITYKYYDKIDSGVYGKEYIIEDYELVAVKMKIKLINKENKKNDVHLNEILGTEAFIYMDDGKLYRNSSLYYYECLGTTYAHIIYNPWMDRRISNIVNDFCFFLEPLEITEGEIIYILGKQDLKDLHLTVKPNCSNIENFNGVYIQFLPFKVLMNLPKN